MDNGDVKIEYREKKKHKILVATIVFDAILLFLFFSLHHFSFLTFQHHKNIVTLKDTPYRAGNHRYLRSGYRTHHNVAEQYLW